MDAKLSMSGQWAAVVKKTQDAWFITEGITRREKEVTVSLCSMLVRPHLEHCLQCPC